MRTLSACSDGKLMHIGRYIEHGPWVGYWRVKCEPQAGIPMRAQGIGNAVPTCLVCIVRAA